jgi:maltooligosyltrehalose trehalohydrolase
MLEWYRALIHLRRTSTWLNDGDRGHTRVQYDDKKHWIRMDRGGVQILINLADEDALLDLPEGFNVTLSSRDGVVRMGDKVSIPRASLAIFTREAMQ